MKYSVIVSDNISYNDNFFDLPEKVYKHNPQWSSPFSMIERLQLNRSPVWANSKRKFIKIQNESGEIISRSVVFTYGTDTVYFGGFESMNDQTAMSELCKAIANEAKNFGAKKIVGPMKYSIHEEAGVVSKGADLLPHTWTAFNPNYYSELFELNGFEVEKVLYAYNWDLKSSKIAEWQKSSSTDHHSNEKVKIRKLNIRDAKEIAELTNLYNESNSKIDFKNFSIEEAKYAISYLTKYGDPELCLVAERNDKLSGFLLSMPNLNEFFYQTKTWPESLRMLHFLLKTQLYSPKTIRVMTVSENVQYRSNNIALELLAEFWKKSHSRYDSAEISYVDSDNIGYIKLLDKIYAQINRSFNLYSKNL